MPRRATEIAVGVALTVLVLRTFCVLGFVPPAVVSGSSMAPAVWGERMAVTCPRCDTLTQIGAETASGLVEFVCPACRQERLSIGAASRRPADTIWINRLRDAGAVDRWRVVVFRSPHDARELCVKRVLGLPGETVSFAEGDLWIDGRRIAKPLVDQYRVRRLEHSETAPARRWRPVEGSWRFEARGWRAASAPPTPPAMLRYQPPGGRPIYDDFPGNAGVTRRLNEAPDLMLELELDASPDAIVELRLAPHATARLNVANRTAELSVGKEAAPAACALDSRPRRVVLSVFDRRALVAVDGRAVLERAMPAEPPTRDAGAELAVLAGEASFQQVTLWKDVYYEATPQAPPLGAGRRWRLGEDEYFVVGDNQAVSLDSRTWAAPSGLPRRLLVGVPPGID